MKPNKKMLETRTNLFSTFRKNLFRRKPNSKSQEPVLLSVKATNSEFTEEENFNKTCQIERYAKCSKECKLKYLNFSGHFLHNVGLLLKHLQNCAKSNQDKCSEAPVLPGHIPSQM